jgi:hypothetical protein
MRDEKEMHRHAQFWPKSLKGRDRFEVLGVDGRITLNWIRGMIFGMWTGSVWLRIRTSG